MHAHCDERVSRVTAGQPVTVGQAAKLLGDR